MTQRDIKARNNAINLVENNEVPFNTKRFTSKGEVRSISPSLGGMTQRSHQGKAERISELQILSVDQACNIIHSYSHWIT